MDHRAMARTLAVLTAVLAASLVALTVDDVSAEQSYDEDLGKKYSMTIQFIFDGADAESIFYDFGDGTTSTEFNPQHTYAETGVYYITQTVYNSYNGGSSSTAVYRIEIMGYPLITFDSRGGSAVASIQQTAYNVTAAQPADPTRSGYTFTGWYTDEACTQAYDWSQGVKAHITLYAGWASDGTSPGGDDGAGDDGTGGDEEGDGFPLWIVALALTAIFAVAALWTRHWFAVILAVACGIVTALLYFGVI